MNCKELHQLSDDYRDGTLDSVRSGELEQHLADCQACEKSWREDSAWMSILAEKTPVGSVEDAAAFTANVLRRISQTQEPSVLGRIARLSAAAAMIAVVLTIGTLMSGQPRDGRAPVVATSTPQRPTHPITVLLSEARRNVDTPRDVVYQTSALFNVDRVVDYLESSSTFSLPRLP